MKHKKVKLLQYNLFLIMNNLIKIFLINNFLYLLFRNIFGEIEILLRKYF